MEMLQLGKWLTLCSNLRQLELDLLHAVARPRDGHQYQGRFNQKHKLDAHRVDRFDCVVIALHKADQGLHHAEEGRQLVLAATGM